MKIVLNDHYARWNMVLSKKHLTTEFLFVLVMALSPMFSLANAMSIKIPSAPIGPTDMEQCRDLDKKWSALMTEILDAHTQCIDAKSSDEPSGSTCSRAVCQSLHDLMNDRRLSAKRTAQSEQCRAQVQAYQDQQRVYQRQQDENRRNAERQYQEFQSQQQSQRQSLTAYRVQQGLNTYKQVQQGRNTLDTAKNLFESPKTTLGGIVANGFASLLGSLATPKTDFIDKEAVEKYDAAHDAAGKIADKTITNPVATLVSTALMEKLRLQHLGMLNTLGEVDRDIRDFGAGDVGSGSQSSGSNWSWSASTQGVSVNVPEVSVNTSDPDPLGNYLESVDTNSWDVQVSDFQSGLRQSMASKSGQIVEAMNWIDENRGQQIQDIGNSYAGVQPQVERQSSTAAGFDSGTSTAAANVNLARTSTAGQSDCQSARPYLEQANEYKKALNQINAQESDYRSGYGSANMDQYIAKLKEGIRLNVAEAARLCPQ